MLQLVGFLLCFYIVFKGVEIYQIALCSPREEKGGAMAIGVLALIAAVILAVLFAMAFIVQGNQSGGLPRF
jgi:hypothetical protein